MISLKRKFELSRVIIEQNKVLATTSSAIERIKAQRLKFDALAALGKVQLKVTAIEPITELEPENNDLAQVNEDGSVSITPQQEEKRLSTAHLFDFDPNRKKGQRKKDNVAAMALLKQIDSGEIDGNALTEEQRGTLAKYSGLGGALVGDDGKKGSAYEYYTPKPIAEGMWGLMRDLGFSGGKVLDPSSGVGIFGGIAPVDAAVDAIELSEVSGRINGLVNSGTGNSVTISPFEAVAANTPDNVYDAIITNVPFGDVGGRGGNQLKDKRYQKEPLQNYFILRSLEKLRPGGLAVFITPPRCISGKDTKEKELREKASYMAEFMGAYRLPNSVFGTADADTITDVIAFRKFDSSVIEKIGELREQSPVTLSESKVLWREFLEGNYFKGEGVRFVLGDFVPKDPDKFRDVDRVVNKLPVGEIAQMFKKFPGSRIEWGLLDAVETMPIIYKEGDTITQAGQTLQMRDGQWVALKKNDEDAELTGLIPKMNTPYDAFENKVSYEMAKRVVGYMDLTSQTLDIPDWLRGATSKLNGMPEYWWPGVVGLSCAQVLKENVGSNINYLESYVDLSEAMQRVYSLAKAIPSGLSCDLKEGLKTMFVHYNKKHGFSAVWRGDVLSEVEQMTKTDDQSFEGLRYKSKSIWVPLSDVKQVMGEDFDPVTNPDYCLSADGLGITKAADYYVGNYGELIRQMNRDIAAATDETLKAKLLRQKTDAESYIDRIDTSNMSFNLFSPYVTIEEKVEFLRRFVDPGFGISMERTRTVKNDDGGKDTFSETVDKYIVFEGKADTDRKKLYARFSQYMKNGTITLGTTKLSMSNKEGLTALRKMVSDSNEQFGSFVKSNKKIVERIEKSANDPDKLRFRAIDDETDIAIPGMNASKKPHGYQAAFIRKQGREFGGINGFNVGLGKTLAALASVQHVQNIGVKKKTLFVVPNSVLSNWRKEATGVYDNMDACMFVGLRTNKQGKDVVQSLAYDVDLVSIRENRHSKIFVTMEAFERIRLKEETIDNFGNYLRQVDASFAESEKNAEEEKIKSKFAVLMEMLHEKTGSAPFLEDLGIDSIVIDEAHCMKNSSMAVNTKSARYLSLSKPSGRGFDAQAKAWYIRGQSPLKDGVLLLTASPITNSPLEIYSMQSLAVGHDRVNDLMMGIKGADDFLAVICDVQSESDVSIDGIDRDINVFNGLNNVSMLRRGLKEIADIKNTEDVGNQIVMPESSDKPTLIDLPESIKDRLVMYKQAFRYAIDFISERDENRGDEDAYNAVADYFGEPMALIGHPFNLINKMTMLIADPELDTRGTYYTFSESQQAIADKVVIDFNNKKIKEKRSRPSPLTRDVMIVGRKIIKNAETDETKTELTIQVECNIQGSTNRIAIDTIDSKTQSVFEAIAEKAGLELDVSIPPKIAALLKNVQDEAAHPRGIDSEGKPVPFAKQIIFCDILATHNKIKMVLAKRAGIPASAIAIITGQTNNTPDEILDIQNGFNACGEDNKYQVILANEKAEVGINLQIGTQAIHHLTIGWTPDSLTQRNGRGVRQGNKTEHVSIYLYDADGTFDVAKRAMVSKKADWIEQVMDTDGGDKVAVTGGLSREQMEALIDVVGDADGMSRLQQSIAAKDAESRATGNRDKQMVNISTIQKQLEFINAHPNAEAWAIKKIQALYAMDMQIKNLKNRLSSAKTETAIAKNQSAISDLKIRYDGLIKHLDDAITFLNYSETPTTETVSSVLLKIPNYYGSRGDTTNDKIKRNLSGSIKVNAESELQSDWQYEFDMAQALIDESKASFTKRAGDSGAYPKSIVDAIAEGKGAVVFGKPVVIGTFVIYDGYLLVVNDTRGSGTATGWDELNNWSVGQMLANAVRGNELIYPGTGDYTTALIRAAAIEDKIADTGGTEEPYSKFVKDVKQYRTTIGLIEYRIDSYILPPPFFPYVINEGRTPVTVAIKDSQRSIIKVFGFRVFTVSSDIDIQEMGVSYDWLQTVRDYGIAHGIKLIPDDVSLYMDRFQRMISDEITIEDFTAAIQSDTEKGIKDKAFSYIEERLSSWFDKQDSSFDYDLSLPYSFTEAINDAIKIIKKSSESPDDIVGVYGRRSKQYKEELKEYGNKYYAPTQKMRYYWDYDNKQWLISRKAFDKFMIDYPRSGLSARSSNKKI